MIPCGVTPQLEENILNNFLCCGCLLQDAHNQSVDNAGVPVIELFKCAHVPAKKPVHQRRVRRYAIAIL